MQLSFVQKPFLYAIVLFSVISFVTKIGFANNANELQVGEPIPPFAFELLDDDQALTNESLEGQAFVLYFWSTSCPICHREMPYLHDAAEAMKAKNVELISLSIDKEKETVREFRENEFPMPWKHSVIGTDKEKAQGLAQQWGLSGLPSKIFVAGDGTVLAHEEGFSGEELLELIEEKY